MGLIIQIAKGYPPKNTSTRKATIDIFNIKSISSCAKDDYWYTIERWTCVEAQFFSSLMLCLQKSPLKVIMIQLYSLAKFVIFFTILQYDFARVKALSNDFTAHN